ncbi:MAG: hypothetical protein R2873_16015 [Caldilineaceae bacterium]
MRRSTSTYDSLAIAWAVVEYIHNHPSLRAKTLFALTTMNSPICPNGCPTWSTTGWPSTTAARGGLPAPYPPRQGRQIPTASTWRRWRGCPKPWCKRAEEILTDLERSGAAVRAASPIWTRKGSAPRNRPRR